MVEQQLHALDGVVVVNVEPDGELATGIAHAIAQFGYAIVVGVVIVHAHVVDHGIDQRRIAGSRRFDRGERW